LEAAPTSLSGQENAMTIRMKRDRGQYPAPHEADVHPDEVANYRIGGWIPADPLDHDGDGGKGGSLPKTRRKRA
jgi:hypothetical protein